MRHFDLVIIGTGSGNAIIDERFADWDVAVVEKGVGSTGAYGGTCLNVGCIPTKMFVHPADLATSPASATKLGVDLLNQGVRWSDVRDRIFGRIDPIAVGGRRHRIEDNANVTVYEGLGEFTGPKRLRVALRGDAPAGDDAVAGGVEEITADRFVVAAGSRPVMPQLPGLDEVPYHTSDDVMRIDELPRRMVILGSGFVAAEFAHVFSAFGVDVTLVARSGVVLRAEDRDVAERFTEIAASKWDIRRHTHAERVERVGDLVRVHLAGPDGPEVVEAESLLVAVGRRPNSDLIAASAGGLDLHDDGRVRVDAQQRASVDGVWALGDVSSPFELKHVANHEERVVQHNLLNPGSPVESDHRAVPHAVFSSPQIAAVGLTEREARERGLDCVTATQDYAGIAYGWAMEDTTGFCKLLADPSTGMLLGAHIIGPQAPSLIQPLIQAMQFGLDARTMARGQYWIHPAMPELVENALLNLPLERG